MDDCTLLVLCPINFRYLKRNVFIYSNMLPALKVLCIWYLMPVIIMMGPFHTVSNLWYYGEIHMKGHNTSNFVPVISWVFTCSKQVAWWNSILQRLSVMSTMYVRHPENGLKYVGNETDWICYILISSIYSHLYRMLTKFLHLCMKQNYYNLNAIWCWEILVKYMHYSCK